MTGCTLAAETYDGTGKLAEALAALYGCSPKSSNTLSKLTQQAKAALGITCKDKPLPERLRLDIYRWHCQQLGIKHGDVVYDVKQSDPVKTTTAGVSVYYFKHEDYRQVHFAVTIEHNGKPRRTTVMLESYLVSALQRRHNLADNTAVRAWIGEAIKGAGSGFDGNQPLTKQVKRLVVESFV